MTDNPKLDSLFEGVNIAFCDRCGLPCQVKATRNENAYVARASKAPQGLCPDCCATQFFQDDAFPMAAILKRPEVGPKALLLPHIQKQFGAILKSGNADMDLSEVNWKRVVENWNLPFPKSKKR